MERGKKCWAAWQSTKKQNGFHILESGWGSNFPEIPRALCESNTCSLQSSQKDANEKTDQLFRPKTHGSDQETRIGVGAI